MKSNVAGRLRMMSVLAALRAGLPSFGPGNTARARPGRVAHSGGTFNAERNAEKRAARADEARQRVMQVQHYSDRGLRAPKSRCSVRLMDMLAERRLRQTGRAA
jgi:hypothetical protein